VSTQTLTISSNAAAKVAGIGLLLMTFLAVFAQFGVWQKLVIPGDALSTIDNILLNKFSFQLAILAFLFVIVLDVIVAWGLYILFKPGDKALSLLTAWMRIIYAAMFGVALYSLLSVSRILSGMEPYSSLASDQLNTQVMLNLHSFYDSQILALIVFGIHLFLLSSLIYRSQLLPKWLGALVAISGLGYIVDGVHLTIMTGYPNTIAQYTFFGELVLMFWLLLKRFN